MIKILLVEDDSAISQPLARALGREGYTVQTADTGIKALSSLSQTSLVILDLGLPDMDGLEVAREIRARGLQVPILMLTARTDEVDMVVGLDSGADDYVNKPFRLAELLARVRALLRRGIIDAESESLRVQDINLDIQGHRVYRGKTELSLTAKEYNLLLILMKAAGNVVSRQAIMHQVWAEESGESSKTLDMHISWLRKKLGDEPAHSRYISTIRGMGFRFETGKTGK